MNKNYFIRSLLLIAALLLLYPVILSAQPQDKGRLNFKAHADWVTEKPSSSMRIAQYRLPKAGTDTEDASLVLYFFGANEAGSVQANLERWVSQIEQPDGSSSIGKEKTEALKVNGLKLTTIDLSGTYIAETTPGSGVRFNKPDYRLRAAVIETPGGAYYVKLFGPARTMKHWGKAFDEYLRSFEFIQAPTAQRVFETLHLTVARAEFALTLPIYKES